MSNQNVPFEPIRIPTLPVGKIVDENGNPTDDEIQFRQALITLLQNVLGEEGLIMPSQNSASVTLIQNNTQEVPGASDSPVYTCQFGTMIYRPSTTKFPVAPNDAVLVSMNDGTVNQAPIFKTITVT